MTQTIERLTEMNKKIRCTLFNAPYFKIVFLGGFRPIYQNHTTCQSKSKWYLPHQYNRKVFHLNQIQLKK